MNQNPTIEETLAAIRAETVIMPGHRDPGALEDCWRAVFEELATLRQQNEALRRDGERVAWILTNAEVHWNGRALESIADIDAELPPRAAQQAEGKGAKP